MDTELRHASHRRGSAWLDLHYAIWAVLAIPIGFVGLVYVLPGLILAPGVLWLVISGALIAYVVRLSRGDRRAWMAGLAVHGLFVLAAPLYIQRWPDLLAIPLALASLYSVVVLVVHRERWSASPNPEPAPA